MNENEYIFLGDVKNTFENIVYREFSSFLNFKKKIRNNLINQNKNLKSKNSQKLISITKNCSDNLESNNFNGNIKNSKKYFSNNPQEQSLNPESALNLKISDKKNNTNITSKITNNKTINNYSNNLQIINEEKNLNNKKENKNNNNNNNSIIKEKFDFIKNKFNSKPKCSDIINSTKENNIIDLENTNSNKNSINLKNTLKFFHNLDNSNNDIVIPKGIFYYPLSDVIRVEDKLVLDFIPIISNFEEFDKIIENTKNYLEEWFDEIPKNLEQMEKISNPEFVAWIFFKSISNIFEYNKIFNKDNLKFNQTIEKLTEIFSDLINKKTKYVCKILDIFINIILKKKLANFINNSTESEEKDFNMKFDLKKENDSNNKLNFSCDKNKEIFSNISTQYTKFSNLNNYRDSYCNICYVYFCPYHFIKVKEDKHFKDYFISSSRLERVFPSFHYRNIYKNQINSENDFKCNLKNCFSFKNNENNDYINKCKSINLNDMIVLFDKKDLYFINLFSEIFENPCFINKYILNNKYECFTVYLIMKNLNKLPDKRENKFYLSICQSIQNEYDLPANFIHKDYLTNIIKDKISYINDSNDNLDLIKLNKKTAKKILTNDNHENNLSSTTIKENNLLKSYNQNSNDSNFLNKKIYNNSSSKLNFSNYAKKQNNNQLSLKNSSNFAKKSVDNHKSLNKDSINNDNVNNFHEKNENKNSEEKNLIDLCSSDEEKPFNEKKQSITYKCDLNEYSPCNHIGKCTLENCVCLKTRGSCEKFCFCYNECKFSFKGCECEDQCESNCRCMNYMRECDPDLCHKNYKNSNIDNFYFLKSIFKNKKEENDLKKNKKSCCNNTKMFFDLSKKTSLSKSIITESYGLFALEDIKQDNYICEYKGELLSREETDRRSVFNDQFGLNYFFKLNDNFDIDAYMQGNEMRYVNHSSYGHENCYAKSKFCRGIYKIGLYANRDVKKGEELFFDYKILVNVPWLNKYKRDYTKFT